MVIEKKKLLTRTLKNIWEYTIGSILSYFPLFVSIVILLHPYYFNPDKLITYLTGLCNLFYLGDDFETQVMRNDLYFVIFVAWISVIVVRMIAQWSCKLALSIRIVIYSLLIITFITRRFLLWTFDMDITTEMLSLLLETNKTESSGFVSSFILCWHGAKYIIKAAIIAFIIVVGEFLWARYIQNKVKRSVKVIATIIVIILMPFAGLSAYTYNSTQGITGQNTIGAINTAMHGLKQSKKRVDVFYMTIEKISNQKNIAFCSDDSIDVVFILGESFMKSHASIYGYYLPTTPCMQEEQKKGNVVLFTDLISPFQGTTPSMKNLFCLNNLSKGEEWSEYAFWPQLYTRAGYETLVFDNQRGADRRYNGSFYEMYSRQVVNQCYTQVINKLHMFDADMIQTVKNRVEKANTHIFAFLHLMGQHFPFYNKCPEGEKVFTEKDIKRKESWLTPEKKKYISDYDNSIRHTDKTLKGIIDIFRNRKAVVVFISDHGEECYDYRDKANRPPMDASMKGEYAHCLHDSPCIVWMSDKYKSAYPDIVKKVIEAKDRPYEHDLIGNMLLTLGRIKTPYYRASDDILSSSYIQSKRFLYETEPHINYDEIK